MVIETRKKVIKIRLRALVMAVACGVLIGLVFTIQLYSKDIFGLEKKYWAFGILGIYLVFSIYFFLLNYHYVYLFIDQSKLILRYYSLRPLSSSKKSFEMPVSELVKAEIKKSAFGLKKQLILYRKIKANIAKYPPVSLTAMSREEIKQMKNLLRMILK